jgi:hypothetical protein
MRSSCQTHPAGETTISTVPGAIRSRRLRISPGYVPSCREISCILALEPIPHSARAERGVVWFQDTNIRGLELGLDHLAYGWSAEAIHEQFPPSSLAQIHVAPAYFYDDQDEFER